MGGPIFERRDLRFAASIDGLSSVLCRADRAGPPGHHCIGPVMPVERKSVDPMAAITVPARVSAQQQSLLHFVGGGRSDERVLAKMLEMGPPEIECHKPLKAWI